ncbi:hypothetical protein P4E94_18460 [Pontiellaceae bacterium B12219]|nr:hypothetical protein [Pontiellaceae bacterium B12219]
MKVLDDLRGYLIQFDAVDASIALCVSDLWIPNISSQVKHTLAFSVLASIPADQFDENGKLDTYTQLCDFLRGLYKILPQMPMLEDYIPEPDWGEIKTESEGIFLRTFYGASVERMPDFITAFNIHYNLKDEALKDMHEALIVQNHILDNVSSKNAGTAEGIDRGHIEVPSEVFWKECSQAIKTVSKLFNEAVEAKFVLNQGDGLAPKSMSGFADDLMSGTALAGYLLRVDTFLIPLSLRNATGQVVQWWADSEEGPSKDVNGSDHALCSFLRQRVLRHGIIDGPCQLGNRDHLLPYEFSAILTEASSCVFIYPVTADTVDSLEDLERDLKNLMNSPKEWVAFQKKAGGIVQIRNSDGQQPGFTDINVVAIVNQLSTGIGSIQLPKTAARVLFLSDFVSIFDSIEDLDELAHFWNFLDSNVMMMGFSGMADQYAAFRDSYSHLVEGAVTPDSIMLDPHWGSNWRYDQLREFWSNAPSEFPDGQWASWKTTKEGKNLFCLIKRREPVLAWCVEIANCTVHFVFRMKRQALSMGDGSALETLLNCLADTIAARSDIVVDHPLFKQKRISVECTAEEVHGEEDKDAAANSSLFSNWKILNQNLPVSADIQVEVNLKRVEQEFSSATDATFEVEAVQSWIEGCCRLLNINPAPSYNERLQDTTKRPPRFKIHYVEKSAEIPDIPSPVIPKPEHYKYARKLLAHAFKDIGAEEGSYELAEAKKVIDEARNVYRNGVHTEIARYRKEELVPFCVEQIDALIGQYDYETTRIKNSLSHEVSFDRSEKYAEAHESYVKESRNCRYLIECALSSGSDGEEAISIEAMQHLIARIDWLMVLYTASDVLHNGIDVAGLELDHSYVPEVVYSEEHQKKEKKFAEEVAGLRMGLGAVESDQIESAFQDGDTWTELNDAFYKDAGLRLNHIFSVMQVLAHWPSAHQSDQFLWKYSASRRDIVSTLCGQITELNEAEAEKILDIITIDASGIRRLQGKADDTDDVPVWEHSKRVNRYTLTPLINVEGDLLLWGAATVQKSSVMWMSSFANGYMPADFEWPNVKKKTERIMSGLTKKLELKTLEVTQRVCRYCERGIDFKRRYRRKDFPDVGDYDVLAYWPETNTWVSIECKYNQPVFCLKDARRLRERIYGRGEDKGQFAKIEKRRDFLASNFDELRTLVDWPAPADQPVKILELYVAKDLHWWLRDPPYHVPSKFLSIETLENWFRLNEFT